MPRAPRALTLVANVISTLNVLRLGSLLFAGRGSALPRCVPRGDKFLGMRRAFSFEALLDGIN